MNDTITKDQVLAAYRNAPEIVQAVFGAELTTSIIIGLREKYKLHIDKAGALGKEVGYLLLGLIDPAKFVSRLKAAGFDEQTVSGITKDVNEKIFIPLQEQMKKSRGAAQQPQPKPVPPPLPSPQPKPTVPPARAQAVPNPARPWQSAPQPQKHFQLQNKIPVSVAPKSVQGPRPDLRSVLAAITPEVAKQPPASKTLDDHEARHITLPKVSPPPVPQALSVSQIQRNAPSPVPVARPIPQPRPVVTPRPAINLPGAMPAVPVPSALTDVPLAVPVPPPKPALTTPPPAAPGVPPKSYSVDPYREPIE